MCYTLTNAQVFQVVSIFQGFLTKTPHAFLVSPIRVTCPAYLILVELITLIIFGNEYSSSLGILSQSPLTLLSLDPHIFLPGKKMLEWPQCCSTRYKIVT